MTIAVDAAVTASQAGEARDFAEAIAELGRLDREQVLVLLGAVTRDVLERAHQDGLDSDDAEAAVASCLRSAADWYPRVDRDAVIHALTGALGVSDPDEHPRVDDTVVLAHGLLLIADQLTLAAQPLAPLLNAAMQEIMRAQTVEMP